MTDEETVRYAQALQRELGQFKGKPNPAYQDRAAMVETELAKVGYAVQGDRLVKLAKIAPKPTKPPMTKSAAAGNQERAVTKAPEAT